MAAGHASKNALYSDTLNIHTFYKEIVTIHF